MKTFKLQFEENVRYDHEIVIQTDLSVDELNELIDEIDFGDVNLNDAAYLLEQKSNGNIVIEEIIESDAVEWGCECIDYNEVK